MTEGLVIDTDVVSFLFKGDSRIEPYRRHLAGKILVLSFMTVAELQLWALQRGWGATQQARLQQLLREFVVCPFDPLLCHEWARLKQAGIARGRPIQHADAWVAATALILDMPLVSHNRRDYDTVENLQLISCD